MCLPFASRLVRVSFHGGSHRAPSASAFQVFAGVVLVPLANASHLGKLQVSVGGVTHGCGCKRCKQVEGDHSATSATDSFLVPRMLSLTQARRGRWGQTGTFLPTLSPVDSLPTAYLLNVANL